MARSRKLVCRPTLGQIFLARLEEDPEAIAYLTRETPRLRTLFGERESRRTGTGSRWLEFDYAWAFNTVAQIAAGLRDLGLKPDERLALQSQTRLEWPLFELATLGCRAVTLPVYPNLQSTDLITVLRTHRPSVMVVETPGLLDQLAGARSSIASEAFPRAIVVIDGEGHERELAQALLKVPEALTLSALLERGKRHQQPEKWVEAAFREEKPQALASIVLTSGTSGEPRGAKLTHDCFVSAIEDCLDILGEDFDDTFSPSEEVRSLSFLPYSHILGRVESWAAHAFGWVTAFSESQARIPLELKEVRPQILVAVPRLFEKAYDRARDEIRGLSRPKRKLLERAFRVAERHHAAQLKHHFSLKRFAGRMRYTVVSRVAFRELREAFGGNLEFVISGGAPLRPEIGRFFQAMGIQILQGYGLTETTGPICMNRPGRLRFDAVGPPLPEVSLKISATDEVLVKSRKVSPGYTDGPLDCEDGWLKTGDLGQILEDGSLSLTGRKKDIIALSNGKKVAPERLEQEFRSLLEAPAVSELIVVGEGKTHLVGLITLNREWIFRYAQEHHILFSEYTDLIRHTQILTLVQSYLDRLNAGKPSHETIRKFAILPSDLRIESGTLTPSLKLRRFAIQAEHQALVDSLY